MPALWWAVRSHLRMGRSRTGTTNSVQSATYCFVAVGGGSQSQYEETIMNDITETYLRMAG